MALYRTGTASMDAQGVITGVDTKWREPLSLIRTGATIVFLTTPLTLAVISDIVSNTEMKAIQTDGAVVPNGNYVILLNDSLTVDGMAQDVAETLRYYQSKETEIEEALEFFKNFDLQGLKDLVARIEQSANDVDADRAAVEQMKNDTQAIKDAAVNETQQIKDSAIAETNQIKAETDAIKTQTQQIKDSAVTEITGIKNEALDARDEAEDARDLAEQSKIAADSAKAGAETARDEAKQWAQQVNPENLLHKDQNLSDVSNKVEARDNIQAAFKRGSPLGADENLDTINGTKAGFYYNPSNLTAGTVGNNYPFNLGLAGSLLVEQTGANVAESCVQTYRTYINNRIFTRSYDVEGGWTPWVEIYRTGSTAEYSDVITFGRNGNSSGFVVMSNRNADNNQVSYSRIYNELQSGVAKTTFQTTREGVGTSYIQFDETGHIGGVTSERINAWLGVGTASTLGTPSIALGDNDTGFKWGGDGVIQVYCNSRNVTSYDSNNMHLNGKLNIWPVDNAATGINVTGTRTGGSACHIGGQVQIGSFNDWRERATGLLVELPGSDGAANVFKAVQWGLDWVCGFDVIRWNTADCEARLNVRNTTFVFHSSGTATASQWVSSSDIRLKASLKDIEDAKEKIKMLTGRTYYKRCNMDDDFYSYYQVEAGLIAQDVQAVLPEAVMEIDKAGHLGINYSGVTALLVNAVKDVIDDCESSKSDVENMKLEISKIKEENEKLKEQINAILEMLNSK